MNEFFKLQLSCKYILLRRKRSKDYMTGAIAPQCQRS